MALQTIPGEGLIIPPFAPVPNNLNSFLLMDAAGEKAAICGRVWNKDRASKNISRVQFRFGTVNKAGGSGLTVSLQDVDLANGPPARPDETQDQTVAIANADAGFVSNVWYRTGALSAARSVAFGELLAVVWEYDGTGHQGSDSISVSMYNARDGIANTMLQAVPVAKIGAGPAWTVTAGVIPNLLLEFDDGTFGTLRGCQPITNIASVNFKQDTAFADEYGMQFQLPFPMTVDGCWVGMQAAAATSGFNVILYDGMTALVTVAVDSHQVYAAAANGILLVPFAAQELVANHDYIIAIQPNQTTSNVNISYFDVNDAAHFQAHPGGGGFVLVSRVDAGAWSSVTTRRPYMGLCVCACDDGAGGGGGGGYSRGRVVNG